VLSKSGFYPESPFWFKNGTDHIPIPLFADSLKQFSDGPAPSAPISEPAPCRNCPIFRNFCNTSPPCLVPCRQIPLLERARRSIPSVPAVARSDLALPRTAAGSDAIERRDWQRAAELQPRETPFPYTDAITWFARGIAAARLHDTTKAQVSVAALQNIGTRLEKAKESYWAGQAEIQRLEVNAWSSLAEGRKELALTTMKSAAEMEDGTDKKAITPGPPAPARELLGEMLLEVNEPAQALEQFEATLKKEPNRFRALYGAARAAQLSANREASRKYFAELLKVCERADKPVRAEVLEANKAVLGN
jgi:tetratricopeptide (TPR) repeat protein